MHTTKVEGGGVDISEIRGSLELFLPIRRAVVQMEGGPIKQYFG